MAVTIVGESMTGCSAVKDVGFCVAILAAAGQDVRNSLASMP
jgi:hypothetical protein